MKITELSRHTNAQIEGDNSLELNGAAGLDEAQPGHVTFLANPRYTSHVHSTRASAIFIGENVKLDKDITILRTKDPYLAYTRALRLFHPEETFEPFIHPTAVIDPGARVSEKVWIGANVVISSGVEIGEEVRIYPNVTIYHDVHIGPSCVIHSGVSIREGSRLGARVIIYNNAVIGSDGFGYAKDEDGHWLKIPQTGSVILEDDVEIGAGTTIDRASVGNTKIARGAKLDNLVQVGHSCTIGEDALLCAQVGLAGSSHIGDRVILAGQVGIAGHLTIGNDVVLTAKSATSHDVPAGKILSGIPAFDNREWLRSIAAFRRLGEMHRTLRMLENRLKTLEESER
jgi:UDP-3-O-[3-hydroxymyristoyl] glucosamine N-acyltransferase